MTSGKISEAMVEAMRNDPFIDDAGMLGTTQQDMRVAHYAQVAVNALAALSVPTPGTGGVASGFVVPRKRSDALFIEDQSSAAAEADIQGLGYYPVFATPQAGDMGAVKAVVDRDALGRMVREAWVRWAQTQPNPKASWLLPYDDLAEPDKEADRQIGETMFLWSKIHIDAAASLSSTPVGEMDAATVEACAQIVEEGVEVPDPLDNHRSTVMRDWPSMDAAAAAIRRLATPQGGR